MSPPSPIMAGRWSPRSRATRSSAASFTRKRARITAFPSCPAFWNGVHEPALPPVRVERSQDMGRATNSRLRSSRTDVEMSLIVFPALDLKGGQVVRSEEHTSELQSLMRISYAVFCLKKKTNNHNPQTLTHI